MILKRKTKTKITSENLLEIQDQNGKKIRAYYDPDYEHKCEVCDHTPCVRIRREDGSIFYGKDMCGCCTWGEADCLDPDNW